MENAKTIQNLLTVNGYKTLAAGGFVRDTLLGREPKDIDLATVASPEKVKEILNESGIKTVDTGLKHGTITAVLNDENYEITTLRVDKKCFGREAEVAFTKSFEIDAQRRDLTVNAMFMDLNDLKVVDYVGGVKDLENKILRFVGDPDKRIKEDYLRILRFYRFSSQLGFTMQERDRLICQKYLSYLIFISPERIIEELKKILIGDDVSSVFVDNYDIFELLIPEIKPLMNLKVSEPGAAAYDLFRRMGEGLDFLKKYKKPEVSLAYLLGETASPLILNSFDILPIPEASVKEAKERNIEESVKIADRFLNKYKFSSQETKKIKFLIAHQDKLSLDITDQGMRELVNICLEHGDKMVLVDLHKLFLTNFIEKQPNSISFIQESGCEDIEERIKNKLKESEDTLSSPLSGQELMDTFNIKPGKMVGQLKRHLKKLVIEGTLAHDDKKRANEIVASYLNN